MAARDVRCHRHYLLGGDNMSDGFWASLHLDILWPILVPQLLLMLKQWWDARVAKKAREEIKCKVDENTAMTETSILKKEHVDLMIAGAERQNISKGIEIGKKQATVPGDLRVDFDPGTGTNWKP